MIQVSSAHFYDTSPVYHIVCSPPRVTSPSVTLYLTPFTFYYVSRLPCPLATSVELSVPVTFYLLVLFAHLPLFSRHRQQEVQWVQLKNTQLWPGWLSQGPGLLLASPAAPTGPTAGGLRGTRGNSMESRRLKWWIRPSRPFPNGTVLTTEMPVISTWVY